jgi:hypothetical protein
MKMNKPFIHLCITIDRLNIYLYHLDIKIIIQKGSYKYEMTEDDHEELLDALEKHPGPVILSGYSQPLV